MTDRISSIKLPEGPENGDRKVHAAQTRKNDGADKRIFWAFFAMVLAIVSLQFSREPIQPPPELNQNKAAEILAGILNRSIAESERERQDFNRKTMLIIERAQAEFAGPAFEAAARTSTYGACMDLVYYIAHDKVWGGAKTEEFFKARVRPLLEIKLKDTAGAMKQLLDNYHANQQKILLNCGADLAQIKAIKGIDAVGLSMVETCAGNLDLAIGRFSKNISTVAIALSLDAYAVYNGILTRLTARAAGLATSYFAKQAARAGASVAAAAVDGPLPIGDILGGIGLIYTGWEISSTREQFGRDLKNALRAIHQQQLLELVKSSATAAERLHEEYAKIYSSVSVVQAENTNNSKRSANGQVNSNNDEEEI